MSKKIVPHKKGPLINKPLILDPAEVSDKPEYEYEYYYEYVEDYETEVPEAPEISSTSPTQTLLTPESNVEDSKISPTLGFWSNPPVSSTPRAFPSTSIFSSTTPIQISSTTTSTEIPSTTSTEIPSTTPTEIPPTTTTEISTTTTEISTTTTKIPTTTTKIPTNIPAKIQSTVEIVSVEEPNSEHIIPTIPKEVQKSNLLHVKKFNPCPITTQCGNNTVCGFSLCDEISQKIPHVVDPITSEHIIPTIPKEVSSTTEISSTSSLEISSTENPISIESDAEPIDPLQVHYQKLHQFTMDPDQHLDSESQPSSFIDEYSFEPYGMLHQKD